MPNYTQEETLRVIEEFISTPSPGIRTSSVSTPPVRSTRRHRRVVPLPAWAEGLPAVPVLVRRTIPGIYVPHPDDSRAIRATISQMGGWSHGNGVILISDVSRYFSFGFFRIRPDIIAYLPEHNSVEVLPANWNLIREYAECLCSGADMTDAMREDYGVVALDNYFHLMLHGKFRPNLSLDELFRRKG